jgi:hypothetical protein
MLKKIGIILILAVGIQCVAFNQERSPQDIAKYSKIIREQLFKDYKGMFREAGGGMEYPFLTPGSKQYGDELWDWDSWLSNVALRQILLENGNDKDRKEAFKYEQGCILNFLNFCSWDGYVPILMGRGAKSLDHSHNMYNENMHKPVLAQHAAFLVKLNQGDAEWLREKFYYLQAFVNNYRSFHREKATGLYYWQNDGAIGVDNDPCTFFRPPKSSGSIYLNCLMYKELNAMVYLAEQLKFPDIAKEYAREAENLKSSILKNCWDERDGFFYSVDLNLLPISSKPTVENSSFVLHAGFPRDWDCLIQRIDVWSGFLALWAGVATPEQASRVIKEHFSDKRTFNAAYGIRSLSKMEKMYSLRASGNPSNWLGPVWGISNYMVFKGLVKYGYTAEAREMAEKTILLFGKDFEANGALHEYYDPDSGLPILNKGFQNWNYLVLNMIAWYEGKPYVEEF